MVAATLADALRHDIHEERKMASVKQENCANGLKSIRRHRGRRGFCGCSTRRTSEREPRLPGSVVEGGPALPLMPGRTSWRKATLLVAAITSGERG